MNILKSAMLVAGLGLASLAANATTYDFSYAFDDGTLLTGSLSGTASGALIQNISNVHVTLNGNAFSGAPLFAFGWNAATPAFDLATPAVLSTNEALNNFIFADNNDPTFSGVTDYFYFVNDPASLGHEAFATNLNTGDVALDNPTNPSWSLVAAAVPEPGTLALLLPGLALVGMAARRGHKRFNESRFPVNT
jgi:hypothetical protein